VVAERRPAARAASSRLEPAGTRTARAFTVSETNGFASSSAIGVAAAAMFGMRAVGAARRDEDGEIPRLMIASRDRLSV
jgi:hypothetical protein